MSYKTILACVQSEDTCASTLAFAAALARAHGAAITALHVRGIFPVFANLVFGASDEFVERMNAPITATAERIFTKVSGTLGALDLPFEWRSPAVNFSQFGETAIKEARYADLVVCAQNTRTDEEENGVNLAELLAFGAGRPVLVLPKTGVNAAIPQRVLVAWNGSREAARAIFDALPLLKGAALVRIVAFVDSQEQEAAAAGECERLGAVLGRHGVRAQSAAIVAERRVSDELRAAAAEHGCDLLVMGCYGHSHMRELILGGASREILEDHAIPVLMAH